MKAHGPIPYLAVVAAAALWGTLGVSYEILLRGGGDRMTLVLLRLATAAVGFLGYAAWRDPASLRAPRAALPTLGAIGVVSFGAFYVVLVYAFEWSSVPVATVLLYTAPAWVAAGEHLFLGLRLTRARVLAIGVALAGCALVAGLSPAAESVIRPKGLAAGVISAITYASYSVLGKRALRTVPPATVLAYGTTIGLLCVIPLKLAISGTAFPEPRVALGIILWPGLAVTIMAVALYTVGLGALRPSTANVIATLEPVVAIVLSALVLHQELAPMQLVGALLVIGGAVYLSLLPANRTKTAAPTV